MDVSVIPRRGAAAVVAAGAAAVLLIPSGSASAAHFPWLADGVAALANGGADTAATIAGAFAPLAGLINTIGLGVVAATPTPGDPAIGLYGPAGVSIALEPLSGTVPGQAPGTTYSQIVEALRLTGPAGSMILTGVGAYSSDDPATRTTFVPQVIASVVPPSGLPSVLANIGFPISDIGAPQLGEGRFSTGAPGIVLTADVPGPVDATVGGTVGPVAVQDGTLYVGTPNGGAVLPLGSAGTADSSAGLGFVTAGSDTGRATGPYAVGEVRTPGGDRYGAYVRTGGIDYDSTGFSVTGPSVTVYHGSDYTGVGTGTVSTKTGDDAYTPDVHVGLP